MQTRTWPYGTRKSVKVLESHPQTKFRGKPCRVLLCAELPAQREAHVIVGDDGDPAAAGDVGTIVFCQGGPNGGYWRYQAKCRSSMQTLFPDIEPEPHILFPLKKRLTAGTCGKGPAGETCRSCAHYCRTTSESGKRVFPKCGLMRHHWTHGGGTDIRAGWAACEYWEPKPPEKT